MVDLYALKQKAETAEIFDRSIVPDYRILGGLLLGSFVMGWAIWVLGLWLAWG